MGKLALEGVRIVDFTWQLAGPLGTKYLADQGAECIKIESRHRINTHRTIGPWGKMPHSEVHGGGYFQARGCNKMSVTLNLATPKGVEVCKRLIKVSDVVVDNFSAGVMGKLGLGYPVLRELNPRLVMVSMAGMGQTGPYGKNRSWGPHLQALSGSTFLTAFPGHRSVKVGTSMSDYIGGLNTAIAVMAALEYRRKTGKGQYVDASQHEGSVSTMGTPLLDYIVNKRIQSGIGNHHPYAAPHGCYRCKGDDRWCVIAVFTDTEWESFCKVIGNPEWTKNPRFATALNRVKNADELDKLIEEWTMGLSPEEVMRKMQQAGVAAGVVQNAEDLMNRDPHLKARGYYESVEHPVGGRIVFQGMPVKLCDTPGSLRTPSPLLGEHTEYVLREILGMSPQEIDQLATEGVLE